MTASGVPGVWEVGALALVSLLMVGPIGYRLATRLLPDLDPLLLAVPIGLAAYLGLTLPASLVLGPGPGALVAAVVLAAMPLPRVTKHPFRIEPPTAIFLVAAAVVAALPAATIMPQVSDTAITVGAPTLDHGKVALIDEIARSGLPPGNPFVGGQAGAQFIYYYLWFLPAAQLRLLAGVTGWGADIAMTWLTAFGSLGVMAALARLLAGGPKAMWWILPLALGGRLRELTAEAIPGFLARTHGLEPWLIQAAWVPQHLFSAVCVVLACLALWRLLDRAAVEIVLAVATGVLAGVAFGSSTWVGGVALAVVLLALLPRLTEAWQRHPAPSALAGNLALAFAAAVLVSLPFLLQQIMAVARRELPIGLGYFAVFEDAGPFRILDLLGFWTVLLPIDLPGSYPAAIAAIVLAGSALARHIGKTRWSLFLVLALVPLLVSQLLRSVVAGNDLGWRSVLVAQLVLIPIVASVLADAGRSTASRWLAAAAALFLALSLPAGIGFLAGNGVGPASVAPNAAQREFRAAPQMWQAVRRHTPPQEAVLNNPQALFDLTPTHGNLGWALLSDRRSCLSPVLWLLAFGNMSPPQIVDTLALADRFFAGQATAADELRLQRQFACRTVVVKPGDGLWSAGLAASDRWRLVDESAGRWRIYRMVPDSAVQSGR